MPLAITRQVSPSLAACELTHLERNPIDIEAARRQHELMEGALLGLGCEIIQLPALSSHPDAVFVEDTAIVLDEVAIITRPGAPSRRGETDTIAQALAPFRELRRIAPPGTLDGGDVLVIGRNLFIGHSSRTNAAGIQQVRDFLAPLGYGVEAVATTGCLHLKTAATLVGEQVLLANPDWVDTHFARGLEVVPVHPSEPMAANALLLDGAVIYPQGYPRTEERLRRLGLDLRLVDQSEFAKAEGGVTCMSLVFRGSRDR